MSEYRLPEGYNRRPNVLHFDDDPQESEWQVEVYKFLAEQAREAGCTRIVDLGCGQGRKLVPLAGEFEIWGVDRHEVADLNRSRFPDINWVGVDFEVDPYPDVPVDADTAVICSDVIEHLLNPEAILLSAQHYLAAGAAFFVLSTPDRGVWRGAGSLGPPENPYHIQEWTTEELKLFMADYNLNVTWCELTQSQVGVPINGTITVRIDP